MENKIKMRFPRALLSTLTSCRTQNLNSDVIRQPRRQEPPIFSPKSDHQIPHSSNSFEPLLLHSPVRRPKYNHHHPSMCKPRCPETFDEMVRENCILSAERRKICPVKRSPIYSSSLADVVRGERRCPPASPPSPLTQYTKLEKMEKITKKKKKKKKKQRKKEETEMDGGRRRRRTHRTRFSGKKIEPFHCHFNSSYEDWFSSDDEREEIEEDDGDDETETLFSSSRSFPSLSSSKSVSNSSNSDTNRAAEIRKRRRTKRSGRRRQSRRNSSEVGVGPLETKVKGSFAVVKSSSDPYNDFQTSMVEMIMEKQIFGADELEQLLQCFLSLNSSRHHRVIIEVFTGIWEALFPK